MAAKIVLSKSVRVKDGGGCFVCDTVYNVIFTVNAGKKEQLWKLIGLRLEMTSTWIWFVNTLQPHRANLIIL